MATGTSIQERKFTSFFNHFDADKDGVIEWSDIQRFADKARQELGWTKEDPRFVRILNSQRACWDQMLKANDLDSNGRITYREYIGFIFKIAMDSLALGKLPPWVVEYCRNVHRSFDLDGDGAVTVKDYGVYLRAMGSDADPKSVFAKLDINKNGKISADEMVVLLQQFVISNDASSPGNYLMTGKF